MLTLATDLDGTLIPLDLAPESDQQLALREISFQVQTHSLDLVFVTGRHRTSVTEVSREKNLPIPSWLICDVGTTILYSNRKSDSEIDFSPVALFQDHLFEISGGVLASQVVERIPICPGLELQEPEKQGRFKLSYYCEAQRLEEHRRWLATVLQQEGLAYQIVSSIDPFNNDGLIDLLPHGINKATALHWWAQYAGRSPASIIYAGDSGNDFAALASDFRAIIVGNATESLVKSVKDIREQHGTLEQLYVARSSATAGVLEGCRWFGLW